MDINGYVYVGEERVLYTCKRRVLAATREEKTLIQSSVVAFKMRSETMNLTEVSKKTFFYIYLQDFRGKFCIKVH